LRGRGVFLTAVLVCSYLLFQFFFAFVPDYILVSLRHPIQRKVVEKGATEGIIAKLNNFNASLDASNNESHEKKLQHQLKQEGVDRAGLGAALPTPPAANALIA